MQIATFDIGTTAVKGVLVSEDGKCICSDSVTIQTYFEGEKKEQNPEAWYEAFCRISKKFTTVVPAKEIDSIIMSGQMQDMIPLDSEGRPVGRAVLYSDGRGEKESEEICKKIGETELEKITGNHYDGSLTFPKVLWMKKNDPENFKKVSRILISSKDYVIYKLTRRFCSDVVACSTAGAMDIQKKQWNKHIFEAGDIEIELFPEILQAHQIAGMVNKEAAEETGYQSGTKVYAGTGDAGATTLASGVSKPGEYNINLGTSGWVATVSDEITDSAGGVFNLAAMPENRYINVVPFLNAGNVHKWVSGLFSQNKDSIDYQQIGTILEQSVCGSHGVFCMPYLAGERFPVMDNQIKGAFYGISAETSQADVIRSCLEGVAFSIRQGIESLHVPPEKISVIGGGGRVSVWCQILADVLNAPLYVYHNAELLPSLAIASAVMLEQGKIDSYEEFTSNLQRPESCTQYMPSAKYVEQYEAQYPIYLKLYPLMKQLRS